MRNSIVIAVLAVILALTSTAARAQWVETGIYGSGTSYEQVAGTTVQTINWAGDGLGGNEFIISGSAGDAQALDMVSHGAMVESFQWSGGSPPPHYEYEEDYTGQATVEGDAIDYSIVAPWTTDDPSDVGAFDGVSGEQTFTDQTLDPLTVLSEVQVRTINGSSTYYLNFVVSVDIGVESNSAGSSNATIDISWNPDSAPTYVPGS